jgi:glycerophosphoryl diester phosphodiesterase
MIMMIRLSLVSLFVATGAFAADKQQSILGYINDIPKESAEHAKERHRLVAEKRARHPLIFHRGAVRQAPENTLEAYALAIDMGADGVEIDIHRTKDGVLVLQHDDTLGRMYEGQGKLKDKTYYELLQARLKDRKGPVDDDTRLPTLAAFLELARQRAILIHLDVKQSGIQDEIIEMIEKADVWDHLVEVNGGNADRIRPDTWNKGKAGPHNKVKLIPYAQNVPLWDGPIDDVRKAVRGWISKHEAQSDRDYMFFGGRDHQERLAEIVGHKPGRKFGPLPRSLRAWWGPEGLIRNCVEPAAGKTTTTHAAQGR